MLSRFPFVVVSLFQLAEKRSVEEPGVARHGERAAESRVDFKSIAERCGRGRGTRPRYDCQVWVSRSGHEGTTEGNCAFCSPFCRVGWMRGRTTKLRATRVQRCDWSLERRASSPRRRKFAKRRFSKRCVNLGRFVLQCVTRTACEKESAEADDCGYFDGRSRVDSDRQQTVSGSCRCYEAAHASSEIGQANQSLGGTGSTELPLCVSAPELCFRVTQTVNLAWRSYRSWRRRLLRLWRRVGL